MSRTLAFLKKELLEMIPPTVFFLVVFHVVVLGRSLLGGGTAISMTTAAAATVGALVVGKSILIADALPLFRLFRERRLIYNILWRVFLYLCVVLVFQVLEELVPRAIESGLPSLDQLAAEIDWARFWGTHLVLALFLVFYTVVTALIEIIGERRCLEILFGWEPAGR
ncbi:MAG: hypothetical protein ACQGVC_20595 [Myxococcota bacterium]